MKFSNDKKIIHTWGCHGRDRRVVGFTTTSAISAKVVSSNPVHGEVYSIQHYVIKFVGHLRQLCGFLRVLAVMIYLKYC